MSHFTYLELELSTKQKWTIAQVIFDLGNSLYEKAVKQSQLKSAHTMRSSQAGEDRTQALKFQKQLMGTLAEIYVQEYLAEIFSELKIAGNWDIVRYDDVRTDEFKSGADEYDIKIISVDDGKTFTVESRSSITYDRSLLTAIEQYDIIGLYSSVAKSGERYNDYYVRPLYEFVDFDKEKYDELKFEEYLKSGKINLYIVAGCTKKEMSEKGYDKSMGQGATNYRVIKILDGYDAEKFKHRRS